VTGHVRAGWDFLLRLVLACVLVYLYISIWLKPTSRALHMLLKGKRCLLYISMTRVTCIQTLTLSREIIYVSEIVNTGVTCKIPDAMWQWFHIRGTLIVTCIAGLDSNLTAHYLIRLAHSFFVLVPLRPTTAYRDYTMPLCLSVADHLPSLVADDQWSYDLVHESIPWDRLFCHS
jgi:hypothetical protein